MKQKSKRVIPGFGISMGVTLTILSIVVLIPLASLVVYTAQLSPSEIIETLTRPRVLASFRVSLLTAFIASAINAVMGVILAWVLVRYKFPLKRILDGMIELPFALPTAVAGIALTSLTADIWYSHCLYKNRHYGCVGFHWDSICCPNGTASIGKVRPVL